MIPRPPAVSRRVPRSPGWLGRIIVAVLLSWLARDSAYAQEQCGGGDDGAATHACEKEAERELAGVYQAILNGIRPGFPALLRDSQLPKQRALFVDAQRAWEAYRDRMCEADAFENYEYSGYGSAVADCRIALTRARIEQLRSGPWGALLGSEGTVTNVEGRAPRAGTSPRL